MGPSQTAAATLFPAKKRERTYDLEVFLRAWVVRLRLYCQRLPQPVWKTPDCDCYHCTSHYDAESDYQRRTPPRPRGRHENYRLGIEGVVEVSLGQGLNVFRASGLCPIGIHGGGEVDGSILEVCDMYSVVV